MVALFRQSLSNFHSYHWVHSHFYTKPSLVYIAEAPTNIRLRYGPPPPPPLYEDSYSHIRLASLEGKEVWVG